MKINKHHAIERTTTMDPHRESSIRESKGAKLAQFWKLKTWIRSGALILWPSCNFLIRFVPRIVTCVNTTNGQR